MFSRIPLFTYLLGWPRLRPRACSSCRRPGGFVAGVLYPPGKLAKRYQPQIKKLWKRYLLSNMASWGVSFVKFRGGGVFRHYLIFKKKNDSTLQSSTWIPLLFKAERLRLEGVEVRCMPPSFPPCHVVFFGMLNLPTVTKIIIFLVGDRY